MNEEKPDPRLTRKRQLTLITSAIRHCNTASKRLSKTNVLDREITGTVDENYALLSMAERCEAVAAKLRDLVGELRNLHGIANWPEGAPRENDGEEA